jgi:hypothetical protein
MKTTLLSMLLLSIFGSGYAQNSKIVIELKVEGQEVKIKDGFEINIIAGTDTVKALTFNRGFYIPDTLAKKRRTVLMNMNQYKLVFDSIPLVFNELRPKWEVGIDFRPILEENSWLIKKSSKKVMWLYTLSNGTGALFTVRRYKRYKPLHH